MAQRKTSHSIVAIGDAHLPFLHRPTFEKVLGVIKHLSPKYIVQMGDLFDMYSFSKFPVRLRFTPKDEIKYAREQGVEMFNLIHKASPQSQIYLIKGNHDERAHKRLAERFGSDLDDLIDFSKLWHFDHVKTLSSTKETLKIWDINFIHGHRSKLGDHMKNMEYQNVVCGHSHTGGVYYHRTSSGRIAWELNAGFVGDPFAEELNYRPLNKFFKWTHGVGIIDAWGPRFVPL